jgi:hypothetical protein
MNVWFSISSPNSNYTGDDIKLLEEGEANLLLLVQPDFWSSSVEKGIVVSSLFIQTPTGTHPTVSSTDLADPGMPGFVIAGNTAQEIWQEIVTGKEVSIEFELSTGVQYSIGIEGEYLDQVSRMFAACIG